MTPHWDIPALNLLRKPTETRGRKLLYSPAGLKVGQIRYFEGADRATVFNCIMYQIKKLSISWKIRAWTVTDKSGKKVGTRIMRTF